MRTMRVDIGDGFLQRIDDANRHLRREVLVSPILLRRLLTGNAAGIQNLPRPFIRMQLYTRFDQRAPDDGRCG